MLVAMVGATLGCGPEVPREQLGHVVFEVPVVPGAEKPYPLEMPPEQAPPPDAAQPAGAAPGKDAAKVVPAVPLRSPLPASEPSPGKP